MLLVGLDYLSEREAEGPSDEGSTLDDSDAPEGR